MTGSSNGTKTESEPKAQTIKKGRKINGVDEALYCRAVAKVGHPRRGKVRINTTLAMKLKDAGFSYKQVGEYLGVSGCTVKRRLREAGLI